VPLRRITGRGRGRGNSAGQAALFLAASGSPVTIVIRGHDLGGSMSRYFVDRIEADARIDVRTNTRITGLDGDPTLTSVRVTTGGFEAVLPCVALFSYIGTEPATGWLSGCAALDERGFVLTDRSLGEDHLAGRWEALGRRPLPLEISYPGLFAAGDVRAGSTKRVAAAIGEGSAAVRSVHENSHSLTDGSRTLADPLLCGRDLYLFGLVLKFFPILDCRF
jgi:thioredoxin reductase (NADPH)